MIAIDLGSNTIRMIEYDCTSKSIVNSYEQIVKTADKLNQTGEVSEEAVERVIKAIKEAKEILNFNSDIKAITTEAIRQANNGKKVIEKIASETDIKFEIISGEDEAYYTTIAVEEFINRNYDYKTMFLIDIGGGSTELIIKNQDNLISESFQIGIVTISQRYKSIEALEYGIKQDVKPFKDFIHYTKVSYRPDIFVASSGTPTTIAALKLGLDYYSYDGEKVNGTELTIEDLDYWQDYLLKLERRHREKLVGVGRGDLIVSGIMIFREIFRLSGFKKCIVCDNGVREGIALDYCKAKQES
jgi:exopolyphosphatase/guanosine-5'-triphosphate,3'-diphosphate pyrophosphatase